MDPGDSDQFNEEGWFPAVALERLPKEPGGFEHWSFGDLSALDCADSAGRKTLDAFLELLGARLVNRNTREAYLRAWVLFLGFCGRRGIQLGQVKPVDVGLWLKCKGSVNTKRQRLAAIRCLFDALLERGVVTSNPAARARAPRLDRDYSSTPVFDLEEIRSFLRSVNTDSLQGVRDKALFSVLLFTWCRVSALVSLKVGDFVWRDVVDRHGSRVRERFVQLKEKRGKEFELPCHHDLIEALDRWLDRAGISAIPDSPVFLSLDKDRKTLTDRPLDRRSVFKLVTKRATLCGILKKVGCHSFRATAITEYLNAGGALEIAQRIAGHRQASTTKIYDRSRDRLTLDELERFKL